MPVALPWFMDHATTTSLHRSFRAVALTAAALLSFGCGGAAEEGSPNDSVAMGVVGANANAPSRGAGDSCAPHTPVGVYTNEDPPNDFAGGGCRYDEVRGYVVVTSIADAPADDYNCSIRPQRIEVTFFDSVGNPLATDVLHNSYGANAPLACLEREGIRFGAHLPARWLTLTAGTCSPTVLRLDAPLTTCDATCF
jgi:hypothetical protein